MMPNFQLGDNQGARFSAQVVNPMITDKIQVEKNHLKTGKLFPQFLRTTQHS